MNVEEQIKEYIASQPELKRGGLQELHEEVLQVLPGCKTWYSDGRNDEGKIVTNPDICYGSYTIHYANGTSREFYRIGLSGTKAGISVYPWIGR